jgi:hypothetical protein
MMFWHAVVLGLDCIFCKQCSIYPESSIVIPHAMCLEAYNYSLQGQLREEVLVMSIGVIPIFVFTDETYLQRI